MKFIAKQIIFLFLIIGILFCLFSTEVYAQDDPNPGNAFLRSLVMPGWGHHYVDESDWRRGQVHLAAEVVFVASYFGLSARTNYLEEHYSTLSNLRAGVDIAGKERSFILAIGEFNSLAEYNDRQLRTRNWNRLIEDIPENRWKWNSSKDRREFASMRSNRDRLRNQLPALISLMVANRVISGVSAFNRARNKSNMPDLTLIPISGDEQGVVANISFRF